MGKDIPRQYERKRDSIQLLKFPSSKNILWDHAVSGNAQTLHISSFRKPKLNIDEEMLRFAQQHVVNSGQKSCACILVGSLKIDEDGEGVIFDVKRLGPAVDTNTSSSHAARELRIPFIVQNGSIDYGSTLEDYGSAVQLLCQRCCAKDAVDLSNFLLVKGWCGFSSRDKCVYHLVFELVTLGTEIQATPIIPVPIVTTALSKNLSGPLSLSHMQGTHKTGYLTMDYTRKLILVLEDDPKVSSLPLVGIWVSGVSHVYSPYIWACCLRYLHNSSIKDRICSPPDPFLLVLYNPMHSKPEFYDFCTSSGTSNMTFDCYTGCKTVQVGKVSGTSDIIEIELNTLNTGTKYDLFQTAVQEHACQKQAGIKHSVAPEPVCSDDITPRLTKPAPYKSSQPMVPSLVPDVSLFFDDGNSTYISSVQQPQELRSQMKQITIPLSRHTVLSGVHNINGSMAQPGANSVQCHPTAAIPVSQGQSRSPSYCSCPSCPKPAQFYAQPYSCSHTHEPLASTRQSCYNITTPCPRLVGSYSSSDIYGGCHSDGSAPNTPTYQHLIDYSHPNSQPFSVSQAANASQMIGSCSGTMQNCPPGSGHMSYQAGPVSSTQNCMLTGSTMVTPSANQLSKPMTSNKLLKPRGGGGHLILKEGKLVLSKTSRSADGTVDSDGTKARSDASMSNSTYPSDNGLRFSHEKPKLPNLPEQINTQTVTSASVDAKYSMASVNWNNLPVEIYQLILEREEQLDQLKAQLAALRAQQSLPMNTAAEISNNGNVTEMDNSAKRVADVKEMCSSATNTSLFLFKSQDHVSAGIQPTLQILQDSLQNVRGKHNGKVHHESKCNASNSQYRSTGNGCDAETPLEIRHCGKLPMNSTHQGNAGIDIAHGDVIAWMNCVQNNTLDTIPSQIIVDLPSFQSSVSRSSECKDEEDNDNSTNGITDCHNKGLVNVIRTYEQYPVVPMLERNGYHGNMSLGPSMPVKLDQENMHLEEQHHLDLRFEQSNTRRAADTMITEDKKSAADTTFIPTINDASMFLEWNSDLSIEMNCLAMKYLGDHSPSYNN